VKYSCTVRLNDTVRCIRTMGNGRIVTGIECTGSGKGRGKYVQGELPEGCLGFLMVGVAWRLTIPLILGLTRVELS
jgi:hypothetical protein